MKFSGYILLVVIIILGLYLLSLDEINFALRNFASKITGRPLFISREDVKKMKAN